MVGRFCFGIAPQEPLLPLEFSRQLEFFTNVSQYKNGNIANFVLAVPLEKNCTNEVYNLDM